MHLRIASHEVQTPENQSFVSFVPSVFSIDHGKGQEQQGVAQGISGDF